MHNIIVHPNSEDYMALIKCLECGKEISDKAETCPSCGHPVKKIQNGKPLFIRGVEKGVILGVIFGIILIAVGSGAGGGGALLGAAVLAGAMALAFFGGLFALMFTRIKGILGFWVGFGITLLIFWIGGAFLGLINFGYL